MTAQFNGRPRRSTASSLTFLDPPEITLQFAPAIPSTGPLRQPGDIDKLLAGELTSPVVFRHSGWQPMRRRILRAMAEQGYSTDRLLRFARCGNRAYVMCRTDNPTIVRVAGSCCRDRWCQPCARDRARTIAANLLEYTAGRQLRFLTLTLKHQPISLSEQLDRLCFCFTALRRTKFWKAAVKGGCHMIEITRNATTATWHPHLHIIIEGSYLPHQRIRNQWLKITGDSHIVDIRAVKDHREVHRYISKYVTKPWSGDTAREPSILAETMRALDGKRLCNTFGTWRDLALTDVPVSDAWENLGSLDDFLRRARAGEELAIEVLSHLEHTAVQAAMARLPIEPESHHDPPTDLDWHRQYDFFDRFEPSGWHHS